MADAGLPAHPVPPSPPVPTPQHSSAQPAQEIQPVHVPQLNWSHFKPEFAGKPEDAEAHLFRMNDWMDMHAFQEGVNVQHSCLTLVGEARLWHESLRPINVDWIGLQNQFRQQYSEIGYIREQLFHGDHFNMMKNEETLDSYVTHIRQVATQLGYGKPHVLEVLNNTLPTRLYRVFFPTENLR